MLILNHRNQPEWSSTLKCLWCKEKFYSSVHGAGGRPAKYCCNAHKMKAYRAKKKLSSSKE